MKFYDTIKGAIFEETGPTKQANTGVVVTKPLPKWEDTVLSRPLPSSLETVTIKVDEGVMRTLKSRIYPGTGPLSVFLATFNSLASAIPDEATRLTAAINVCTAQGGSIQGILSDIGTANSRLTTEKQNFEQARAAKLAGEIDSRDAKIAALSREIIELTTNRDSLAKETEALREEINVKTVNYTASLGQIAADLDAMERKLKGAK